MFAASPVLTHWILQSIAMMLTALFIPKLKVSSLLGPILAVISISLVNAFLWDPSLFFELPNSLSSRALTVLVTNGVIFWIVVKALPGIEIEGILPALIAPVVFSVMSMLISKYAPMIDWVALFEYAREYMLSLRESLQNPSEFEPTVSGK